MVEERLRRACAGGRVEDVGYLLDGGWINETDRDGRTPLFVASREGQAAVVELLLARGADIDKAREDGWTPLHFACRLNSIECAELLLANNASVDQTEEDGMTPLHVACFHNSVEIVVPIHI